MPLHVKFDLKAKRTEDRKGDEPRVQIAFITLFDRDVQVIVQDTGRLAENFPGRRLFASGTQTLYNIETGSAAIPTEEVPYLGIVVRLIEDDNSPSSNRIDDRERFRNSILLAAQGAIREGRLPTIEDIWTAGNSAKLNDRRRRDDDDKLGVSARIFKEAGKEIAADIDNWSEQLNLRFVEDDADYVFDGVIYAEPNIVI